MSEPGAMIRCNGLAKDFGRRVLDGIDLAIDPGEIVGYLGANRAGKTTTIRGQRHFTFSQEASQLARAHGPRADWFVILALFMLLYILLTVAPTALGLAAASLLFLWGTRAFLVSIRVRPQPPG